MAHPRSQLLALVTTIPFNVLTTVYESPGAITTLVKEWELVNYTAGPPAQMLLYLVRGVDNIVLQNVTAAFIIPQIVTGRSLVLEAGDQLQMLSLAATNARFTASGFHLQAP